MPYNSTGGQTYTLASSISSTQSTILLSSFLEPVSGTPYTMSYLNSDIEYATLAPKTTQTEFISFTGITQNADGTATLTGVTRGLSRSYPYTSSATYKLSHGGQTQLVLSNSPQQINESGVLKNNSGITGFWTAPDPVAVQGVATKNYVDNLVNGGPISVEAVVISGVAGETLAVNDVVYFKLSDQRWWLVKANDSTTFVDVQIGYGKAAAAAGGNITIVIEGQSDGFSPALTAGQPYYATNAGGQPSLTPGSTAVFVGWSLTTTSMLLQQPTGVNSLPNVSVYTASHIFGASDTVFTITNPAGTTYRYTWTGTGVDPVINSGTTPVGTRLNIQAQNFATGNKGQFTTTGVGVNYFEVTNASGVAEATKTVGTGYIGHWANWVKPSGASVIEVVLIGCGGGGAGGSGIAGGASGTAGGGGGGGYSRAIFPASVITTPVNVVVGTGGSGGVGALSGVAGATANNGNIGGDTTFGSYLFAGNGGFGGAAAGASGAAGVGITGGGAGGVGGAGTPTAGASSAFGGAGGGGGSVGGSGGGGSTFAGGSVLAIPRTGGTGGNTGGTPGGDGSSAQAGEPTAGAGGGGGNGITGNACTVGGAGGFYGGGGGGGGTSQVGNKVGGYGGNGGAGIAVIVSY